jgi:hypothetical protein
MPQLTLDRAILERLLKHASSSARLVGFVIGGGPEGGLERGLLRALAAGPLDDHIDAIVHILSGLLGHPHLIDAPVPSARSSFVPDVVPWSDSASTLAVPDAVAPGDREADDGTPMLTAGSQITLDRSTLEKLLNHAASAARLVGYIDDDIAAGPLGDHVDAIVHGLTELLGGPHALAAHDAAPDDRAAHDAAPMLASSAGGAP